MAFDYNVVTVQDALVDLLADMTDANGGTAPTVATTQAECGYGTTNPAIWVRRGRLVAREEIASDMFLDTRNYQALVYVTALNGDEYNDESAFDSAANWIDHMHLYLAQNRNNVYKGIVIDLVNVRDSGDVSVFVKDGERYSGVAFTIPLIFYTRF